MSHPVTGNGTKDDPWVLRTPPGQSEYLAYRDTDADPPTIVCIVGKTTLGYQLRCLEDLHEMLVGHGDWMALGTADEQKPAVEGTVEAWGRSPENPAGGWYGVKKGLRGRFANYVPPVMEHLGLAELEHNPRNNRMRARCRPRDMAKTYHLGRARRLINAAMTPLARLGLAGRHTYILTVRGRRSGKSYSIPLILIEAGERWLVAPYGDVGWVRNAPAAGEVQLTRAGRSERMAIEEVGTEQAAPILQRYLKRVPVVRPFFDVSPDSQLPEFETEAPHHPVFRLTEAPDPAIDSQP